MTDFDPTTNRIPFGLLMPGELKALKEWPHGFEVRSPITTWMRHPHAMPLWQDELIYRGVPAPVVVSTWANVYADKNRLFFYSSREGANFCALSERIAVLRIDTCNGVSTAHLEDVQDDR